MTAEPLLRIESLRIGLPAGADRDHAVDGLSLDLGHGETLCVVGESGSGKSVTAQSILGLLPPRLTVRSGRILFENKDLLQLGPEAMRDVRGRRISMIFQEPSSALDPVRTIGDQVGEMILAHERMSKAEVKHRVIAHLADVNLPDPADLRHAYPFRLSGGQQQRVMIAMALALGPAILIADEPTTALDVTTQAQILQLIRRMQAERGTSVLFITHDMGIVTDLADRIAVMRHGGLVESGVARDVLAAPGHEYTRQLIASVPRLQFRTPTSAKHSVALEASGMRKIFAGRGAGLFRRGQPVKAIDDVSFSLRRGETVGIVGESGSGKSTVARCLLQLTPLDAGSVRLSDLEFSALRGSVLRRERRRIQIIFQDPFASLNPRQTVETIVGTPLRVLGRSTAVARERTREVLRLVGLDDPALERYPHEFSGGQRQRIGIARALVTEPEVLVADEAVSSLDVSVQAQVLKLLDDIRRRLDLAMVFITHDLRIAAQICDRVLVMKSGRVVEEGRTADIFAAPQHDYTRGLLAAIPGRSWFSDPDAAMPARQAPHLEEARS